MQLCGFGKRRALDGPALDCTRAEGRASPSRKRVVGQARGSCLRRWSTLPAASRHANIDYVLPYPTLYILYICIYIFPFIFLIRALEIALGSGKSHNRNGTVLASDLSPRDRGKSHGRMAWRRWIALTNVEVTFFTRFSIWFRGKSRFWIERSMKIILFETENVFRMLIVTRIVGKSTKRGSRNNWRCERLLSRV